MGEAYLNYASKFNLAFYFTLTNQFELAKQVLDTRFLFLYLAVYCFSVFDSYRETIEINKVFTLASREGYKVNCFAINSNSFTHINAIPPWYSAIWSAVLPGAGCFLIQRMNRAFLLISVWAVISFNSRLYPAIVYTLTGQFDLAKSVLDIQWFMNIPSLWFYSIYESYSCAIENNKLYRWELSKYMKSEYQNTGYKMPCSEVEMKNPMYIMSVFEYSSKLEEAVTALQMKGIPKEAILSVPLDRRNEGKKLFDTVHSSDSISMLAFPMILAMLCSLLCTVLGFHLAWGPILWGFVGALGGFLVGLGIRLIIASHSIRKQNSSKFSGIIVIVRCEKEQAEMAQDLLWANAAMGVSTLSV